jgi:hypothetical protein
MGERPEIINPEPAVPSNCGWNAGFGAFTRREMMENQKIKRWELTLSPMGIVHLHYEILLSSILQEVIGGLARELHQLADELKTAWDPHRRLQF